MPEGFFFFLSLVFVRFLGRCMPILYFIPFMYRMPTKSTTHRITCVLHVVFTCHFFFSLLAFCVLHIFYTFATFSLLHIFFMKKKSITQCCWLLKHFAHFVCEMCVFFLIFSLSLWHCWNLMMLLFHLAH